MDEDEGALGLSDSSAETAAETEEDILKESIAPPPPAANSTSVTSPLVECPLCMAFFPSYAIEVHASECGGVISLGSGVIMVD